jgi:hypothetical protein
MLSFVLPHPAGRGDSQLGRMTARARAAEAVVGRGCAFVVRSAQSRQLPGDRMLVRFLAAVLAFVVALVQCVGSWVSGPVVTDAVWPITRHRASSPRL